MELHPLVARVEKELRRLSELPAASSSADQTACAAALAGLQQLHSCVGELLCSPLAQQAFAGRRREKWVAEELEGSIRLLDLSGAARDLLVSMKEQVRDLQLVLRRRSGGRSSSARKIGGRYLQCRRRAQRDVNKCLAALKGIDDAKYGASAAAAQDPGLPAVVRRVRAADVTCNVTEGS